MVDLSVALIFAAIGLAMALIPRSFLVHPRPDRIAYTIATESRRVRSADRPT